MKKNIATMSKIGGLGLAGVMVFGAAQTQAAEFGVTTAVQNTLEVTVVNDLNLGTLFAATANSSAVSSLTLDPTDGSYDPRATHAIGAANADDAPAFLSLGGQVPASGSVATAEDFDLKLPAGLGPVSGASQNTLQNASDFNENNADVAEVRIGGTAGDPNVARFYLADFTIGNSNVADANITTNDNVIRFAPGFGITEVTFDIGATVYTDGSGGTRRAYEAGTYTGNFDVTAEF